MIMNVLNDVKNGSNEDYNIVSTGEERFTRGCKSMSSAEIVNPFGPAQNHLLRL
jgi:hypothetical protein